MAVDFARLIDLDERWFEAGGQALYEELALTHPLASIWWGADKAVDSSQLEDVLDTVSDDFADWLVDNEPVGEDYDAYVAEFRASQESSLTGK